MRLLCGVLLVLPVGCATLTRWNADRWVADYDSAEQRLRESGRELLIYYRKARGGRSDDVKASLASPAIARRIQKYVRCVLFQSYEPDRRYVAQFAVQRAPALVLMHADGTYHAHTGSMADADILRFLSRSRAPGAKPVLNPHIPRRARYDWQEDMTLAGRRARSYGKAMLIVYHRSFTRDWRKMTRLLKQRDVARRLGGVVHCRVATNNPWAKTYITEFGVIRLPALILTRPDGSYRVLETPTSSEAVARFADLCLKPEAARHSEPPVGAS